MSEVGEARGGSTSELRLAEKRPAGDLLLLRAASSQIAVLKKLKKQGRRTVANSLCRWGTTAEVNGLGKFAKQKQEQGAMARDVIGS